MQSKLALTLEENAMDSLVHGVEHYLYGKRESDRKYVIMHVFHAVELFLKERLAKQDEKLIFSNRKNGHTVGANEALKRLVMEVNVPLDSYVECKPNKKQTVGCSMIGDLENLRQARNSIEHSSISIDDDQITNFLGAAFRFLDDFVSRELGLSLEEKLESLDEERWEELSQLGVAEKDIPEQDSYKTLSQACLSYTRYMLDRGIPLHPKRMTDYELFVCELCGEDAVVVPDPRSYSRTTYCYNCRAIHESYHCPKCEQQYIEYVGEWEKGCASPTHPDIETLTKMANSDEAFIICQNCWDSIGDS